MIFQFGFYSSLLLITFTQGILYSVLLLKKGFTTQGKSDYWLSAFIFLCCLYIAPWMLGFAGWYDNQPFKDLLFYLPFQQLFLFGPVIYGYTQSLLNPSFRFRKGMVLHFLPAIFYLIYQLAMWCYDRFIFKGYYFYADGIDKDFDLWYQYTGLASMAFYLVLSIRYHNLYRKLVFQVTSFAESILFKWIKTYLISFLILMLLPVIFDGLGMIFPEMKTYQGSWWFFLTFSMVMNYIAISAYANPVISKIHFEVATFGSRDVKLLSPNLDEQQTAFILVTPVAESPNDDPALEIWKEKIDRLMVDQELYKNSEFTLADLAKQLNTNLSVTSKAINQGFGLNFNDFVNSYRIAAVRACLDRGEQRKVTLLGIAFNCGFNSKATFNRAFKKYTGFTPSAYLRQEVN